jgi:hypothetical protein
MYACTQIYIASLQVYSTQGAEKTMDREKGKKQSIRTHTKRAGGTKSGNRNRKSGNGVLTGGV